MYDASRLQEISNFDFHFEPEISHSMGENCKLLHVGIVCQIISLGESIYPSSYKNKSSEHTI